MRFTISCYFPNPGNRSRRRQGRWSECAVSADRPTPRKVQGDEGKRLGAKPAFLSERGRFRELSGQHAQRGGCAFSFIQIMSRGCSVKHHGQVTSAPMC